jgi:FixJ family two-component response regulator
MDGRTMLDELRWLGYQMPVLAMSGGLDIPALRQLLNEGAQGFFLKPFTLQSLKQSCQQIFKKGRNV